MENVSNVAEICISHALSTQMWGKSRKTSLDIVSLLDLLSTGYYFRNRVCRLVGITWATKTGIHSLGQDSVIPDHQMSCCDLSGMIGTGLMASHLLQGGMPCLLFPEKKIVFILEFQIYHGWEDWGANVKSC